MSAQFFGRSGKVLYGAFSIVGMASQPHNVNKGIPDDRVARSSVDDGVYGFMLDWPFFFNPAHALVHASIFVKFCSLSLCII